MCVCSLRFLLCSADTSYFHLWHAWLCSRFSYYLKSSTICPPPQKKLFKMKCVFWFSLQFWNFSHSKKNWARCDQKRVSGFTLITRYSCQILMKIEFSRRIFEKFSNMEFNENLSSRSRVFSMRTDRQTDRHEERNSHFSQFCETTQKVRKVVILSWWRLPIGSTNLREVKLFTNVGILFQRSGVLICCLLFIILSFYWINCEQFYFHCYNVYVVEFTQLKHQLMHLYESYTLKH